jgi:PIN domain nuclease of toxin-antitoxin system
VNILLDTNCLLWAMAEPERLGENSRALLENKESALYLSVASSWEIAIKARLGKLPLPSEPEQYIADVVQHLSVNILDIQNHHALQTYHLPTHHNDPFDRLLIAQAQVERLMLMSADRQFRLYEVDLLWGLD